MTLLETATESYNTHPRERIHAFQIKDGSSLLGYIWFGEYEPENAAGVLAYNEAGEAGERAAAYWQDRLDACKAQGMLAPDAVLELRDEAKSEDIGKIEHLPITVKNLTTLAERSSAPQPGVLDEVRERRHQFIVDNN